MIKNDSIYIRKLQYLSTYRGCKESEIIFQRFAKKHLFQLTLEELNAYEEILECNDAQLMDWLIYKKPAPEYITSNMVYHLVLNCLEA